MTISLPGWILYVPRSPAPLLIMAKRTNKYDGGLFSIIRNPWNMPRI